MPATPSWHLPHTIPSDTIARSDLIVGPSGKTRPAGGGRILVGAGIVPATAMLVYAAAGGMRHPKFVELGPLQTLPAQIADAQSAAPAAPPFTAATPVVESQPSDPAPPAQGFNAPASPTPDPDKKISESNTNHSTAHRRHIRRRQTSFQKARAFLRRIF